MKKSREESEKKKKKKKRKRKKKLLQVKIAGKNLNSHKASQPNAPAK